MQSKKLFVLYTHKLQNYKEYVIIKTRLTIQTLHACFRKALKFFRGGKYEFLKEELEEIVNAEADKGPTKSFLNIIGSSAFLKPLSAALIIVLFRLSGFSILSHYTATYLEGAGINLDPLLGSIMIGAARWLGSLSTIMVLYVLAKKTAFKAFGLTSVLSWMSGK